MFHSTWCIEVDPNCKGEVQPVQTNARGMMETIIIRLKMLSNNKKAVKESFQLKQVNKFSNASKLKIWILTTHGEKFEAPTFDNLEIGFYSPPR